MTTIPDRAEAMYRGGYNCAQAVFACCGEKFGFPRDLAIRVAQGFGGGMCMGATCGAVTGGIMAIGLKHAKKAPDDNTSKAKAHDLVVEFVQRFKDRNRSVLCNDLLGLDMGTSDGQRLARETGLFKKICPKMVRDAAEIIDDLLSAKE